MAFWSKKVSKVSRWSRLRSRRCSFVVVQVEFWHMYLFGSVQDDIAKQKGFIQDLSNYSTQQWVEFFRIKASTAQALVEEIGEFFKRCDGTMFGCEGLRVCVLVQGYGHGCNCLPFRKRKVAHPPSRVSVNVASFCCTQRQIRPFVWQIWCHSFLLLHVHWRNVGHHHTRFAQETYLLAKFRVSEGNVRLLLPAIRFSWCYWCNWWHTCHYQQTTREPIFWGLLQHTQKNVHNASAGAEKKILDPSNIDRWVACLCYKNSGPFDNSVFSDNIVQKEILDPSNIDHWVACLCYKNSGPFDNVVQKETLKCQTAEVFG